MPPTRRLLLVLLPWCLTAKPRRPRQQEDSSAPPWLTDAYLPDASKFPPAHQPNNHQRGRREATRLARADAITHRAICKLPTSHKKEVTALTPAKLVLEAAAARGGPVLERSVYERSTVLLEGALMRTYTTVQSILWRVTCWASSRYHHRAATPL